MQLTEFPADIVLLICSALQGRELAEFLGTCRRFWHLVRRNSFFWKSKWLVEFPGRNPRSDLASYLFACDRAAVLRFLRAEEEKRELVVETAQTLAYVLELHRREPVTEAEIGKVMRDIHRGSDSRFSFHDGYVQLLSNFHFSHRFPLGVRTAEKEFFAKERPRFAEIEWSRTVPLQGFRIGNANESGKAASKWMRAAGGSGRLSRVMS